MNEQGYGAPTSYYYGYGPYGGSVYAGGNLDFSVSPELVGENAGAAIGGAVFAASGPEFVPVGIGIGNFVGGVAGDLLGGWRQLCRGLFQTPIAA